MDDIEGEIASLTKRQEVLYEDRLDGRIDTKLHDSKAIEIRQKIREFEDQLRSLKNPAGIEKAGEALAILERCRTAAREYPQRSGPEKRKTVENVVLNASWGDGRLDVTFRKPYDLLADTNAVWKEKKAAGAPSDSLRPVWYRGRDLNPYRLSPTRPST